MKIQQNSPLNYKLAIKLSIFVNLLMFSFVFIGFVFSDKSIQVNAPIIVDAFIRFFTSSLFAFMLFEYSFWIYRKKWKTNKKIYIAFFGVLGLTLILSPLFARIAIELALIVPEGIEGRLFFNLIKDLIVALIVFLITQSVFAVVRGQQVLLENERLMVENTKNRYEALKNQLNPHFLFNTLNTLDGLIGLDDEKAHEYLQNLSSSFRYTIQNKEITTLKKELDFVNSYAYLMSIRYGDNLNIQYDIDEIYNDFFIMPISLQLLIENAIKHNVINDKYPLTIHIKTTKNDTIKVCNTIQPKINIESSEGVGLANLAERYQLLFGLKVVIRRNDFFEVEIPLIKHINEKI
ncbi:MAG: histidine kinase [Bacteroidales bacterium]|nr:histidine kinase [Bacteroidales bacterium]